MREEATRTECVSTCPRSWLPLLFTHLPRNDWEKDNRRLRAASARRNFCVDVDVDVDDRTKRRTSIARSYTIQPVTSWAHFSIDISSSSFIGRLREGEPWKTRQNATRSVFVSMYLLFHQSDFSPFELLNWDRRAPRNRNDKRRPMKVSR